MLDKLFGRRRSSGKRVIVIGLDGVPYSFIRRHAQSGELPNMARMLSSGSFFRMNSVIPTVSSCAWSSYMTGKNPAGHGIFGFIDRRPNPFSLFIPNARNLRAETIWEKLSRQGKRVIVINVPVTYPPKPVNGILIGGFLGTDVNRIGYPPQINRTLAQMNYVIDVDASKGHTDREGFVEEIHRTFEKRIEVAKYLMEREKWDFFQLHVMETDRINHFFWEDYERGDPNFAPKFMDLYRKIDDYLGEIWDKFGERENYEMMVLSDHGFCTLKKEVYLNLWLEREGYLSFRSEESKSLENIAPESKAYSLIPGRIFINLKGREEMGSVEREDYEPLRDEIAKKLIEELKDPEDGTPIVERVYRREEIYDGPYLEEAADLIAVPKTGYDLKGKVSVQELTGRGRIVGMHTYDDAFLFVKGEVKLEENERWIGGVNGLVFRSCGINDR